jgi:hypothetical protein
MSSSDLGLQVMMRWMNFHEIDSVKERRRFRLELATLSITRSMIVEEVKLRFCVTNSINGR